MSDIDRVDGRWWNINYSVRVRPGKVMRMNSTPHTKARGIWSRLLTLVGGIAMLIGALDPMEGSIVILPGSGLVVLGTWLGQSGRRLIAYRVWVFILIAMGVGALWGLSSVGGIGGSSGHSMWWGLLVLPYLIGWSMGIWGPGSPRWLLLLGMAVGLWYLAMLAMVLIRSGGPHGAASVMPVAVIGTIGVVTIGGCILRLRKRIAERP